MLPVGVPGKKKTAGVVGLDQTRLPLHGLFRWLGSEAGGIKFDEGWISPSFVRVLLLTSTEYFSTKSQTRNVKVRET
jgi:hypothetical protein